MNFEQLKAGWVNCRRCSLCNWRKHVVFGRGEIPAPLLLVGLGPGRTEDLMGTAFYGKAGRVLNKALALASEASKVMLPEYYITNVIGCRPTDELYGPNRDPRADELEACRPRLWNTIRLVKPQVIVFMGDVARSQMRYIGESVSTAAFTTSMHPAACLYQGGVNGPLFRPLVQSLADALRGLDRVMKARE